MKIYQIQITNNQVDFLQILFDCVNFLQDFVYQILSQNQFNIFINKMRNQNQIIPQKNIDKFIEKNGYLIYLCDRHLWEITEKINQLNILQFYIINQIHSTQQLMCLDYYEFIQTLENRQDLMYFTGRVYKFTN